MFATDKTDRIAYLNDLARREPAAANCQWIITPGVAVLLAGEDVSLSSPSLVRLRALCAALAGVSEFSKSNDPYREHDFGTFDCFGERLWFKIDYLHPDDDTYAPDPANIELCRRVMTLMLEQEY
jgi:hypothetical protein